MEMIHGRFTKRKIYDRLKLNWSKATWFGVLVILPFQKKSETVLEQSSFME
jgi:hypothetical protein